MKRMIAALSATAMALGCGSEDEPAPVAAPPAACASPSRVVGDRCLEPGVQDDGCPAGTLGAGDGVCVPAGIQPDGCGEGFVHDGFVGCEPILPPDDCPPGLTAVPGDTVCRPVASCAAGKWGDIPVDATTEHVDGAYAGGGSNGTPGNPWTTIGAGIDAAAPGAIVAVAAGTYVEDVDIAMDPVRLWGVCPEQVEIVGVLPPAALSILVNADGAEVRGVAVSGPHGGVVITGSEGVVLDRVWVHDTGPRGIGVEDTFGPTSVTITGSLVERANTTAVHVAGAHLTMVNSEVRDTEPRLSDGKRGRAFAVQFSCPQSNCDPERRGSLELRGSLVTRNHETGIYVAGSDITVDASVVQGTLPTESDDSTGIGLRVDACRTLEGCPYVTRSNATIRASVIQDNHTTGILHAGSDLLLESSVVRRTLPQVSDLAFGDGIIVQACLTGEGCPVIERGSATIRSSLVAQNHETGVFVSGSDADVEAVVVGSTLPRGADLGLGFGLAVQRACAADGCDPTASATLSVRGSVVEDNHTAGVFARGGSVTFDGSVVRRTLPQERDGAFGRGVDVESCLLEHGCDPRVMGSGVVRASIVEDTRDAGVYASESDITVEDSVIRRTWPRLADMGTGTGISIHVPCTAPGLCDAAGRSRGTVRRSIVEDCHGIGVMAMGSDATVEASLVQRTLALPDGRFGDGIVALASGADGFASVTITSTRVEQSARAGVSAFGSLAALADSRIQCAAFDLETATFQSVSSTLEDRGGNLCGCPSAGGSCVAASVGLEPPDAVTSME